MPFRSTRRVRSPYGVCAELVPRQKTGTEHHDRYQYPDYQDEGPLPERPYQDAADERGHYYYCRQERSGYPEDPGKNPDYRIHYSTPPGLSVTTVSICDQDLAATIRWRTIDGGRNDAFALRKRGLYGIAGSRIESICRDVGNNDLRG